MKGILVLEDGSSFEGISIGTPGEKTGRVILNTAVVGYQEIMTDPSNAGKIIVLTYPLIGNYGVAEKFNESSKCSLSALVIKEDSAIHSNWQATDSFGNFIKKEKVLVASGVDTRTLAIRIRDRGEMLGIISTGKSSKSELLKKLKNGRKNITNNHISGISVAKPVKIKTSPSGADIAVLDLGMLNSFMGQLKTLKCNITLLPYGTPAGKILEMKPDGLIVSNGPEEDRAIPGIVRTVRNLVGKIPIMGISAGHEIICLALGGRLKKLKTGHHGVNYPIKSDSSLKGEITVQNHSYTVDENSIKNNRDIKITLRNLNDNTIEEIESRKLKIISTQYYPACPGFDEVNDAFKRFLAMTGEKKGRKHAKA